MPFVRPPFAADKMTAARLDAELSRSAVADLVGVHRQRVYDWEVGTRSPHAHQLPALASALAVRPTDLVDGRTMRALRYAAGFTQAEAASAVGVARAEWGRWEAGLPIPERFDSAVRQLVGG